MLYEIDRYPPGAVPKAPKRLGEQPHIHPSSRVGDSRLGSWTDIGPQCSIVRSSIGDYTYAAGDVSIIYSRIGKFCSIASHVRINPGNHPMDRVTQHHLTYRREQYGFDAADDADFFAWREAHGCVVDHDVWIGHAAILMPGVSIGTGAVVGAGAVVTKNVAPYEIVGGVPARHIRWRFAPDIAQKLLEIAWWEWDRSTLEQRFHDLLDLPAFVEKYG